MSQFGSGVWAVGGGASDFRDARLVFKSTLYTFMYSYTYIYILFSLLDGPEKGRLDYSLTFF